METILNTQTTLRELTEKELIEGLQTILEEKDRRLHEFEFYHRFAEYIYKVSLHKFRNFGDTEFLARDVLQNTFITAFRKIGKFKFPGKSLPVDHGKIIRAWLGKIANIEGKKSMAKVIDSKIEYDSLNLPEPEYDQFEDIYGDPVTAIPNEFSLKLQSAMNQLSEKEKDVIMTYAREGCINTNWSRHISDEALQYLCEYYKTTVEAIKQCKKRALEKIKKACFE